jgi:hypothetical protein
MEFVPRIARSQPLYALFAATSTHCVTGVSGLRSTTRRVCQLATRGRDAPGHSRTHGADRLPEEADGPPEKAPIRLPPRAPTTGRRSPRPRRPPARHHHGDDRRPGVLERGRAGHARSVTRVSSKNRTRRCCSPPPTAKARRLGDRWPVDVVPRASSMRTAARSSSTASTTPASRCRARVSRWPRLAAEVAPTRWLDRTIATLSHPPLAPVRQCPCVRKNVRTKERAYERTSRSDGSTGRRSGGAPRSTGRLCTHAARRAGDHRLDRGRQWDHEPSGGDPSPNRRATARQHQQSCRPSRTGP